MNKIITIILVLSFSNICFAKHKPTKCDGTVPVIDAASAINIATSYFSNKNRGRSFFVSNLQLRCSNDSYVWDVGINTNPQTTGYTVIGVDMQGNAKLLARVVI